MSMKKVAGNLNEIALNLWINLGTTDIITMMSSKQGTETLCLFRSPLISLKMFCSL